MMIDNIVYENNFSFIFLIIARRYRFDELYVVRVCVRSDMLVAN